VVYALVIINVMVFMYNGSIGRGTLNPLAQFALVPAELTAGRHVGALPQVSPWVTIFTSMFIHANLLHIGGNLLYLWIFGNNIEDRLGHVKFLLFYLATGAAAAAAQIAVAPHSTVPMVGASGAIAGVLGAYLILFPQARIITLMFVFLFVQVVALPASIVLGFWIVLQVLNTLISSGGMPGGGVAYAAHVGGFVAGLILIRLMDGGRSVGSRRARV
jgi:membrane associated rhomboid family serine protease